MPNSYGSWRTGIQIDNIYPVGSIYISVNSTNPHDLFGGTWETVGGRFLIGVDSTYTAGSTGGAGGNLLNGLRKTKKNSIIYFRRVML